MVGAEVGVVGQRTSSMDLQGEEVTTQWVREVVRFRVRRLYKGSGDRGSGESSPSVTESTEWVCRLRDRRLQVQITGKAKETE